MKPLRVALPVFLLLSSPAAAGVVTFTPEVRVVDPAVSWFATFTVGIELTELPSFDAVDMIIGSDDLRLEDWEPLYGCFFIPCGPYPSNEFYASEFKVGTFGVANTAPFDFGLLTLNAAGLAPGDYTVLVDADRDGHRSSIAGGGGAELLHGVGTVRVVPEPGTLCLLGLGVVRIFRRHRVASGHPHQ